MEIKTKKQANEITGGLSSPSKMPGKSWAIPASSCKRGSNLRNKKNSICSKCYASKNRYTFTTVIKAGERRLDTISDPNWADAMVVLIKGEKYFRWFDSGDLQNVKHLRKIVEVAERTPNCKHRLPTKEVGTVKLFLKAGGVIPDNLNIRISADYISQLPAEVPDGCNISTCSVDGKMLGVGAYNCPATFREGVKSCSDAKCYRCWNKSQYHINYKLH